MENVPRSALLVTPHQDDAEGGCGGTIGAWTKRGTEVVYLASTAVLNKPLRKDTLSSRLVVGRLAYFSLEKWAVSGLCSIFRRSSCSSICVLFLQ